MNEEMHRLELIMELEETKKDLRHVERRVDDLEAVLARVLEVLVCSETPEDRREALEIAEELPTMRAYLDPDPEEE